MATDQARSRAPYSGDSANSRAQLSSYSGLGATASSEWSTACGSSSAKHAASATRYGDAIHNKGELDPERFSQVSLQPLALAGAHSIKHVPC